MQIPQNRIKPVGNHGNFENTLLLKIMEEYFAFYFNHLLIRTGLPIVLFRQKKLYCSGAAGFVGKSFDFERFLKYHS